MGSRMFGWLAVGLLVGPMAALAGTIIDTGVPVQEEGGSFTGSNRAAQFVITEAVTVQSIESYFQVSTAGNLLFSIYSNRGDDFPGDVLYFTTVSLGAGGLEWRGISGLSWLIGPGTYWVATSNLQVAQAAAYQTSLGSVANPMLKEASFSSFANPPEWQERFLDSGWRIQGLVDTDVPEPGTLALLGLGLAGLGLSRRRRVS